MKAAMVAGVVLIAMAPASALAQSDFTGAGETSELDCAGGVATVTGADNTLRITGPCKGLEVEGASNRITIDLAQGGSIRVVGASNEIRWSAPGQYKPKLSVTGAGNRISRRQ